MTRQSTWLGVCLCLWASVASAQVMTISSPGTYVLSGPLSSTGTKVIQIDADNVVLDLNGFSVTCAPSSPSTAITFGVYALERKNVTIKRGAITGCWMGVHAGYADHVTLEDVALGGSTYIGANLAGGAGSNVVRRVTCAGIGGYTGEAYAICINGMGPSGLVDTLTVTNVYKQNVSGTGEGVGLLLDANATSAVVRRLTCTNAEHRVNTICLWSVVSTDVRESAVTNWHTGFQGAGLTAIGNAFTLSIPSPAGARGIWANSDTFSNNTFTGYDTPWEGTITDGGGNTTDGNPPPPPPSGSKFFRICVDGVCYEGMLPMVSGV